MYISINLKKLRFLHKHERFETVADLDFIAGVETNLTSVESPHMFHEFTDAELTTLYRHTTNHDHAPAVGDSLRFMLMELAERFPVTDADALEAAQQATYIEVTQGEGSKQAFAYVRGASRPRSTEDVLFSGPLPFTKDDGVNAVRKHGQRLQQRAAALAAAVPPPAPSAAQAPRSAPTARPRSGVCEQIWTILDTHLAQQGTAVTRNDVKAYAAQFGWNSSTASVQFAAGGVQKTWPRDCQQ